MESPPNTISSHFSDLRKTCLRCLAVIFFAALLLFYFYDSLFQGLIEPLHQNPFKTEIVQLNRLTNESSQLQTYLPSGQIIANSPAVYKEGDSYIIPPSEWIEVKTFLPHTLAIFSPAEGLIVSLQISLFAGAVFSSPIWLLFILQFVQPALYPSEKKLLFPFIVLSFFFMLSGALIAYYCTLPLANEYFYAFNQTLGMNIWGLKNYIDYTLKLIIAHALGFEIAAILFFLVHLRRIHYEQLAYYRRHACVLALVIGAVLTPPDVLSQLMLACPLMLLYELIVFYARIRQT